MSNDFYNKLTDYLKSHDIANANNVIMQELGNILIKDKTDFVLLLNYADLPANVKMSDSELITLFIDNIHNNRKLLIGAAFLVSNHNKQQSFDGEQEISDTGTKAVHKVMFSYFDAGHYDNLDDSGEEMSSAVGGAWAGAVDSVAKLGGGITQGIQKKKAGAFDTAAKKQDAKNAMVQSVLDQRKAQAEALRVKNESAAKTKRIVIISVVGLVVVAGIVGAIVYYKKNK